MTHSLFTAILCLALAAPAVAQEPPAENPTQAEPSSGASFRIGGEMKLAFRQSAFVETPLFFPFPPSFIPPGQTAVFQRTVADGPYLELANLALVARGELSDGVTAKAEVHVLDLYNRNPTSSDDRILLREAWVLFGRRHEAMAVPKGTSFYVLAGLAPRFTKQVLRRLESYGLWGTAVGRFEQPQIEIGGTVGTRVYWRAMAGNGNPVFFRDPNALAGDNGTPERVPGAVDPIYQSGFPILYDAKPADINLRKRAEWGAGLGLRAGDASRAVDVLGWYFRRDMENAARIRGTFYRGDLQLLRGVAFPLPFRGDQKAEWGANLEARARGLRIFGQYVDQKIAELPRRGFEAEAAYRFPLNGLFLVGETPIGNWIQPVVRVSRIDIRFEQPRQFPGLSVGWDWTKLDVGLRVGLTRNVDLTAEYSRNDMVTRAGTRHPDETLVTLRTGF